MIGVSRHEFLFCFWFIVLNRSSYIWRKPSTCTEVLFSSYFDFKHFSFRRKRLLLFFTLYFNVRYPNFSKFFCNTHIRLSYHLFCGQFYRYLIVALKLQIFFDFHILLAMLPFTPLVCTNRIKRMRAIFEHHKF